MSTPTLADIVEECIKRKAQVQASDEREAFAQDMRALLVKHGLRDRYSIEPMAINAAEAFAEARAAMLAQEARENAARRILEEVQR